MASFQKYMTKDGPRWLYKYYGEINPNTGKKKPSTKRGFKTKKEAQLDAAQIEKEVAEGSFVTQDKTTTFQQVYEQWYETNSPNFKPSTKKPSCLNLSGSCSLTLGQSRCGISLAPIVRMLLTRWQRKLKQLIT